MAWSAAASGRSVAVVDPEPGRGATWAAAGMLAPVAEAAFGEQDLALLNLAAAGAWPGFARDLEAAAGLPVHYRDDGTLVVAGGPRTGRRPTGCWPSTGRWGCPPSASAPGPAGTPNPSWPRVSAAGSTCPATTRSTTGPSPWPWRPPAGPPASSWSRDRVTRVGGSQGRVDGVELEDGGHRAADVVVLAAGSRSGGVAGLPEGWRPPSGPCGA